MKKIIALLLTLMIIFTFSGCSSKEQSKEIETESVTEETVPETPVADEKILPSSLLPDMADAFPDGEILTLNSDYDSCYYRISNYAIDEYDAYVDACKDAGFIIINFEGKYTGGKMFLAYTEDEQYYIELIVGTDAEYINLSCSKVNGE